MAAGMTEQVGQRVAARSKEVAADLRRPRDAAEGEPTAESDSADVPYEEMGQPD
jgi:hypothetical protein